jgi:hypothetical protein
MSADPKETPPTGRAPAAEPEPPDEVERWWGSYSFWTKTPSFLVCLLLTGVILWLCWYYGWGRAIAVGAGGVLWLVQSYRLAACVFGYNYRLTNRHLWLARGVRRMTLLSVELRRVARVTVERTWLERRLGVGRVCVVADDPALTPLILEGVRQPSTAADLIRDAAAQTREEKVYRS